MREFLGLLRAGWVSALSYRMGMVFAILGLAATLVPLYFVAGALQPLAARSIADEGGQYFGFVALGMAAMSLVVAFVLRPASVLGGAIGNGTLEALLASPAPTPAVLLGLVAYDWCWAAVKAILLVAGAVLLGAPLHLGGLPAAALAVLLTLAAYGGIGLMLCALVLWIRTSGPLASAVLTASSLLGGVYYSTSVIPSWIQRLAAIVPLTYGLRAVRQALLAGQPLHALRGDLWITAAFAVVLGGVGVLAFTLALRHARREGSLGQY